MKCVAVLGVLMFTLCLSATESKFLEQLEQLEEDVEIVDMDDALHKLRLLKSLRRLVAEEEAKDSVHLRKRFIFDDVKEAFEKIGDKIGDFFTDTWNKAKDQFNQAKTDLDFKETVEKVKPYIHSGMSIAACQATIGGVAFAILGPAASLIGVVSHPLCNAALAQLQKAVD